MALEINTRSNRFLRLPNQGVIIDLKSLPTTPEINLTDTPCSLA